MLIRLFLESESIGYMEPNILLCSIYRDSDILLSVLSFSNGLSLLKKVSLPIIFVLFVLEYFITDLSGVAELGTRLQSTVPERMSTISVSQKLYMFIKGSIINQKVFPFLSVLLKLEYKPKECYSPTVHFLIPKKLKLISDITNLLLLETIG